MEGQKDLRTKKIICDLKRNENPFLNHALRKLEKVSRSIRWIPNMKMSQLETSNQSFFPNIEYVSLYYYMFLCMQTL